MTKGYHVNSLAVPRKAKEAIGGITKLTHTDGNSVLSSHSMYSKTDAGFKFSFHLQGSTIVLF